MELLAPVLRSGTERQAQKILKKCWTDKVAITWAAEDVRQSARGAYRVLNKKEVQQVLQALLNHDASVGVNWDVVQDRCVDFGRPMTDTERSKVDNSDEEDADW